MKKIHKRSNSDANRSIFARSKRWSSDAITKDIKDEDTDLAMSVNVMSSSDLCLKEGAKSYVKLNYRKLTFKTKSLKGSSPVWSQVFFLGPFETTESLEISCWDKGSKWKKELLGRGTLSFTNFTKEGTYQHIIQLDGGKRNEVNGNTINGTIICGIKVEKNPLKRKSAVLGRRELDYWLQRRPEAEELVQKNLLKPVDLTHSPASGLIFAQSLENVMEHQKKHYPDLKTPALVENAISFITSHLNESTGIFRMNPPVGKLNQLQQQIDSTGQVEFQPDTDLDIVATLLKRFFRDLQPAILPSPKEFKEFKSNNEKGIIFLRKKVNDLTSLYQLTLKNLMKFLNTISITPKLLMTSNNLALMFSPNLYPPELYNTIRKATRQKSGNLKVEVVRHMIDYYAYVFGETNELPTFKVNQQENKEEDEEEVVTEMNKTVSDPLGTQENTIKAFDSTEELANQKEEKPKENHSVEEPKVNDIEEKPNTQE